jgi:hypothetical protein
VTRAPLSEGERRRIHGPLRPARPAAASPFRGTIRLALLLAAMAALLLTLGSEAFAAFAIGAPA